MEIRAPMVGTIIEILVEPGTRVDEDEEVLVIESMKMQIPVTAPAGGTVESIAVTTGQVVQEGDLLLSLA